MANEMCEFRKAKVSWSEEMGSAAEMTTNETAVI